MLFISFHVALYFIRLHLYYSQVHFDPELYYKRERVFLATFTISQNVSQVIRHQGISPSLFAIEVGHSPSTERSRDVRSASFTNHHAIRNPLFSFFSLLTSFVLSVDMRRDGFTHQRSFFLFLSEIVDRRITIIIIIIIR